MITVIGQTNFRSQARVFGIHDEDRRGHMYVIGKTGMGKTTLLRNMLIQDIRSGKGLALVDPHGDLASDLMEAVPPERINDVVYFDPADVDFPIGFNVLEAPRPEQKYLVASGLVGTLKKIWADSWGPRLEYILRNTILALLDYPNSTMLGIGRMLTDKSYRNKVVSRINDPVVKSFWVNEFANYSERFMNEAISPIQNKVGQFLSSSIIRNIVSQPRSTLDIGEIMNGGKVLIMNLSKGKIGEDNSALLGAMMITRIQLAAMDRASMAETERRDFYLYVDEFQNFATESFASILSEARKYRLDLVVAHQYITQMEEEVRDAVFGNVGTMVVFRVGAFDAEYLEKEFAPNFLQADIVNLDRFNAYVRLMIGGVTSKPFSMKTIPPAAFATGNREKVVKVSRERYARPRAEIEEKVMRWSLAATEPARAEGRRGDGRGDGRGPRQSDQRQNYDRGPRPPRPANEITDLTQALAGERQQRENRQAREGKKMYPVKCDRCGRDTEVPFQPTPGKPVYCRECLAIVRAEAKNYA